MATSSFFKRSRSSAAVSFLCRFTLLFLLGGFCYIWIEMLWRGHSHTSIFFAGGFCLCLIDRLSMRFAQRRAVWLCVACGLLITAVEFCIGCVVNLWLGLHVWDYSGKVGSILGQICPLYTGLWCCLALVALWLVRFLQRVVFARFSALTACI